MAATHRAHWVMTGGLALGVMILGASARLQAQASPSASQAPAAAAPGRVFASDAGMVLNFVKADMTATFEKIVARVRDALHQSDKPGRRAQAAGWKVFRAVEPGPNGSVLYLFVMDPVAKGQDYTISNILAEAFPAEVQQLYKEFSESYAQGQNVVRLNAVAAATP